jgi:hypothetical protein
MNFLVDVEETAGRFTCCVIAQHLQGRSMLSVGGDYQIEVTHIGDGWRMSSFQFAPVWTQGDRDMVPHATS